MKQRTLFGIALMALPLVGGLGCTWAAPPVTPTADPQPVASAPPPAIAHAAEGAHGDATAGETEPFGRLTVDELEAKMADAKAGKLALAVYDNNQESHFKELHILGATWLKSTAVTADSLPANKETMLVFYCANEH